MAIMTMNDLQEEIEKLGWSVNNIYYSDGEGWEIGQYSPAGEDFWFDIQHNNSIKEAIKEIHLYFDNFDVDEHIEMWAESKIHGSDTSIPSIRRLAIDAEDIDSMLNDLATHCNNLDVIDDYYTTTVDYQDPKKQGLTTLISNPEEDNNLYFGEIRVKIFNDITMDFDEEKCTYEYNEKGEIELFGNKENKLELPKHIFESRCEIADKVDDIVNRQIKENRVTANQVLIDNNYALLRGDKWYIRPNDNDVINIYYNPDSTAGGQFVETHYDFDSILENENLPAEQYFEKLAENAGKQYLIDVDDGEFADYARELIHGEAPDAVGLDDYTKSYLINGVKRENAKISLLNTLPINKEIGIETEQEL